MKITKSTLDEKLAAARSAAMGGFLDAVVSHDARGCPVFTIAPNVAAFGPLVAEVDAGRGFTLSIGVFMHTHFARGSNPKRSPTELAAELVAVVRDVLADKIVVFRTQSSGGMLSRESVELLPEAEAWGWSGRLHAHPQERESAE